MEGRTIPLTQGLCFIVDEEDYERVSTLKWTASKNKMGGHYVTRAVLRGRKRSTVYLHRMITAAPPDMVVDHKNHNGLDNRRSNLRVCTRSQNSANFTWQTNPNHPYKGVYRCRQTRWRAKLEFQGKQVSLGSFLDPREAARAYDKAAESLWGEFASLNFPEEARAAAHRGATVTQ